VRLRCLSSPVNWWTLLRALGLLAQVRGLARDPDFPVVFDEGYDYAEDPFVVGCDTTDSVVLDCDREDDDGEL
jgi:hypothetical protein